MRKKTSLQPIKKDEVARLRNLRSQMDMSVREFAKEFRVAFGSVSQWENGIHSIPGSVMKLVEIYEERLEKKGKK